MNQKYCRRALRGRRHPIVVKIRSFCHALRGNAKHQVATDLRLAKEP
jgi:hypothetical protein